MKKGVLIAVFWGILTLVLAGPAFAQTPLPDPPFNLDKCLEISGNGTPFEWDPTGLGKCIVSPPHR